MRQRRDAQRQEGDDLAEQVAGVIDEEPVARPFDPPPPRQGAVQGIPEPIDQKAHAGEPQPSQGPVTQHIPGSGKKGPHYTERGELIRYDGRRHSRRDPSECRSLPGTQKAIVDPLHWFHRLKPAIRTIHCDSAAGSTDRNHIPKASVRGKAMRARLRSSPRRIKVAARSGDINNGLAPGKRSLIGVRTKPGNTTFTAIPWGASHPRIASP